METISAHLAPTPSVDFDHPAVATFARETASHTLQARAGGLPRIDVDSGRTQTRRPLAGRATLVEIGEGSMVQVDVIWTYGIGVGLGLASASGRKPRFRELVEEAPLFHTLLFLAVVFAPSG